MSQVKEPKTPSGAKKKASLKSTTLKEEPPKKQKKQLTDDQIIAAEIKEEMAKEQAIREQKVTIGNEPEDYDEEEAKSSEFIESDLEIVETASGNKVKRHRRDSPMAKKDRKKLNNLLDDESNVKKISDEEEAKLMKSPIDQGKQFNNYYKKRLFRYSRHKQRNQLVPNRE